jgi:hypothetical protein
MSGVLGTIFYLLLRLMIYIVLRFTYGLLAMGMTMGGCADKIERLWVRPSFLNILNRASGSANWSESLASTVIYLFLLTAVGFLLAYIVSYIYSTATIIYALMRKKVDGAAYEQIYRHLEQVKE